MANFSPPPTSAQDQQQYQQQQIDLGRKELENITKCFSFLINRNPGTKEGLVTTTIPLFLGGVIFKKGSFSGSWLLVRKSPKIKLANALCHTLLYCPFQVLNGVKLFSIADTLMPIPRDLPARPPKIKRRSCFLVAVSLTSLSSDRRRLRRKIAPLDVAVAALSSSPPSAQDESWVRDAIRGSSSSDVRVVVFSKTTCPFCHRVKHLLDQKGIQVGRSSDLSTWKYQFWYNH